MDKMRMESPDLIQRNIEAIGALFPNCITETRGEDGAIRRAINFDMLRQMLTDEAIAGDEAYEFTWVGKKAATIEASRPIQKTLRPCLDESKDWDNTKNLYIEGDNLDVLKLIQESYLGRIKIIYIDPPYNTGHDFIYRDSFVRSQDEENTQMGMFDDETGERYFENTENNGRFHSDWCSMIYSRLLLTRGLLTDDGVVFISIGQREVSSLISICNEVFGERNQCGIISRVMKSGGAKGRFFSPNIEYVLVYCKSIESVGCFREPISDEIINKLYTAIQEDGPRKGERYRPFGLYQSSLDARPNQRYFIECPDGEFVIPPGKTMPSIVADGEMVIPQETDGCWRWSRERYIEERNKGNIAFKRSKGVLINSEGKPAKWNIYTKIWLNDRQEEGMVPVDLITKWENRAATKELAALSIPFDFAKPTELIKYLIEITDADKEAIILDFFSGSATTADAVMQLNAIDNGHRKFIMVQLPEMCAGNSEAGRANFSTVCEIGKERIRRAGERIKANAGLLGQNLDIGFRVLKVADSNMKNVYFSAGDYTQSSLTNIESNIKDDRTSLDLLYGCLLEWGLELSLPYSSERLSECIVHTYNDGDLIAC